MYSVANETKQYELVSELNTPPHRMTPSLGTNVVCDRSCVRLLTVQWILSRITAWGPMVGTPINQMSIQFARASYIRAGMRGGCWWEL